jgi:hypothetical protein
MTMARWLGRGSRRRLVPDQGTEADRYESARERKPNPVQDAAAPEQSSDRVTPDERHAKPKRDRPGDPDRRQHDTPPPGWAGAGDDDAFR